MGSERRDQVQVDVDRDVYDYLRSNSTFEDTFSAVLRRELGIQEGAADSRSKARALEEKPRKSTPTARRPRGKRSTRPRAAAGTLLPEGEYYRPILEILLENGGRLPKQAVIDELGRRLHDRFTDADQDTLESGGIRWQSRAQFARLRLAERQFIDKTAPRGTWAITEEGERALEGTI
jgi:Mrr N-terminal domain